MRKDIRRRHDAHLRAHDVCTEHRSIFDASEGGKNLLADFGTRVTEAGRLLANQKQAIEDRQAATYDIRQLRLALRAGARVIVRIGRLVKVDDATMSTMEILGNATDADLTAYVQGMLDRTSPHAEAFVAAGVPPDLFQDLAGRLDAFAAAREAQTATRRRFSAALLSIRAVMDKTDDTVDALEAIAVDSPGAHPEVLAKLRAAKRVGPRVASQVAQPAPVVPAPSPTPTPVPTAPSQGSRPIPSTSSGPGKAA